MSLKNNIYVQFGLNNPCTASMNFNPCVSVRHIIVFFFIISHKIKKITLTQTFVYDEDRIGVCKQLNSLCKNTFF